MVDTIAMSTGDLRELINMEANRLQDVRKQRNYAALEREMVERFYGIAQEESRRLEERVALAERDAESSRCGHQTELRVYEQKMRQLDFEKKQENKRLDRKEVGDVQADDVAYEEGARINIEVS
eukprot:TRINITY_DN173095_c0_g1_i1.p1 TRINITY_DN173095_c0_g1~~TRINITY_DN173095_c0_g1_i1.p1  ORF type:complete len:124 (-),score=17.27 TRINITY_DN173095_c0_g1_i1:42-413(-)